jgi:hypothetical protein
MWKLKRFVEARQIYMGMVQERLGRSGCDVRILGCAVRKGVRERIFLEVGEFSHGEVSILQDITRDGALNFEYGLEREIG